MYSPELELVYFLRPLTVRSHRQVSTEVRSEPIKTNSDHPTSDDMCSRQDPALRNQLFAIITTVLNPYGRLHFTVLLFISFFMHISYWNHCFTGNVNTTHRDLKKQKLIRITMKLGTLHIGAPRLVDPPPLKKINKLNVHVWLQIVIIHTLCHYTCSYIVLWELATINVINGWSVRKTLPFKLHWLSFRKLNFFHRSYSFQFF